MMHWQDDKEFMLWFRIKWLPLSQIRTTLVSTTHDEALMSSIYAAYNWGKGVGWHQGYNAPHHDDNFNPYLKDDEEKKLVAL